MSLLLGARARKHVVILTDGISIEYRKEGEDTKVSERDLVKIFPSGRRPFALAHHGENRLGSLTVGRVLEGTIPRQLDPSWPAGLNRTIARTIDTLDSPVSQRLKASPPRKICAFWLAGLWPCTDVPEIAEVAWIKSGPSRVRIESKPLGDLSVGGSGGKYVKEFFAKPFDKKFGYEKIFNESVEYSIEFLKKLYAHALEKQEQEYEKEKKTLFGGTARMALITEDGIDMDVVEME